MRGGKEFHILGAETRKAREPSERLWHGTERAWLADECVDLTKQYVASNSLHECFFNLFFEAEPFAAILIAHGTHGRSQECLGGNPMHSGRTMRPLYCGMIVHGCLKDTVIELLLFVVCVLLFLPHWLWSFYLFLFTVSLLDIRLSCFNKLELSWENVSSRCKCCLVPGLQFDSAEPLDANDRILRFCRTPTEKHWTTYIQACPYDKWRVLYNSRLGDQVSWHTDLVG